MMFIKKDGQVFHVEQTENSITEVAVNEFHIKLEADKTKIAADGIDTAKLTAKVYNYENQYQVGFNDPITFTLGNENFVAAAKSGQAQIEIQADIKGQLQVAAAADGVEGAVILLETY